MKFAEFRFFAVLIAQVVKSNEILLNFDFCRLISQAVISSVPVFACVSVRDSVQVAPGGAENTR